MNYMPFLFASEKTEIQKSIYSKWLAWDILDNLTVNFIYIFHHHPQVSVKCKWESTLIIYYKQRFCETMIVINMLLLLQNKKQNALQAKKKIISFAIITSLIISFSVIPWPLLTFIFSQYHWNSTLLRSFFFSPLSFLLRLTISISVLKA